MSHFSTTGLKNTLKNWDGTYQVGRCLVMHQTVNGREWSRSVLFTRKWTSIVPKSNVSPEEGL